MGGGKEWINVKKLNIHAQEIVIVRFINLYNVCN